MHFIRIHLVCSEVNIYVIKNDGDFQDIYTRVCIWSYKPYNGL